jgi:hypothetical protein
MSACNWFSVILPAEVEHFRPGEFLIATSMLWHWSLRLQRTEWGGIADDRFRSSGFFRVAERNGVFWLVDPDEPITR